MVAAKKTNKVDPFKTKKSKSLTAKESDTLTPTSEIAKAIDLYRECQDQAKHFEGESTIHKDLILAYAQKEFSKRLVTGTGGSFKLLGDETMVTYVIMDSSAGLTDEDVAIIAQRWGDQAAEDLVTRDFRSIRFDPKVLEARTDYPCSRLNWRRAG